jgi:hypothetical protein
MFKLGVLALAGYGAKTLYDKYLADQLPNARRGGGPIDRSGAPGAGATSWSRDTATGTDPRAKYTEPGYQDKSLGQAVNQDQQLVDQLVEETRGDLGAAEARFRAESAGAPVLDRQNDTAPRFGR